MAGLYPEIEPYNRGFLAVDGENLVYWETCGNPRGKTALVLHGGPGSGCTPWHRRLFDPDLYRVVLFDQRNCGRSTPHASEPDTDLYANTTPHLIADIECLRVHLEIEEWLVLGGSWGSTLALAYAETFPMRVTEMVLFGITTGRRSEVDWLFRGGAALFFPEQWEKLRLSLPAELQHDDVLEAYYGLLNDSNPSVRAEAATSWCLWESSTEAWPPQDGLSARYTDRNFAVAFARIVTHYMRHNLWLPTEGLLPGVTKLENIRAVLVNGDLDFQAPIGNAWALHQRWPGSELVLVENAGHVASNAGVVEQLVDATDRLAKI